MKISLRTLVACCGMALFGSYSLVSQAEITLIHQDPQPDDLLSRLNFTVGGSLRPQVNHQTGGKDNSYKRNGFDGGTRFRFSADYYLFDDIQWVNHYELGVNIPALFNWDNHYDENANDTTRRKLYTGLKSKAWQFTFGKQNSVYYDTVGVKTDIWDYDMLAQAPGNGINGDYDGSYLARKTLKYKTIIDDTDIYASYLFADDEYLPGDGLRYKRKGGGSVGVNYRITPTVSWGTAWNYTRATMRNPYNGNNQNYNQNIIGSALSWTPANWVLAVGGGWYQNFLPTEKTDVADYFAGDGWGIEYFAGYKFLFDSPVIKHIQPYFMGNRLQYENDRHYQRIDNGLGISLQFKYGFRLDYEHVFTSGTDNQGDMNLIRLWFDF